MDNAAESPHGMHALALVDDDLYAGLERVLKNHSRWQLHRAGTLEEVSRLLENDELRNSLAVALCAPEVEGGGWRDLLARLNRSGSGASVVVVDRQAGDDLWKDVLGGGGYEVLRFPPDPHELFRVVTQAWRRWHEGRLEKA